MKSGVQERVVMWRDASFWGNPGRASRFHLPRAHETGMFGHPVAMCSQHINLDDENTLPESAAGDLMCRRCARMRPND